MIHQIQGWDSSWAKYELQPERESVSSSVMSQKETTWLSFNPQEACSQKFPLHLKIPPVTAPFTTLTSNVSTWLSQLFLSPSDCQSLPSTLRQPQMTTSLGDSVLKDSLPLTAILSTYVVWGVLENFQNPKLLPSSHTSLCNTHLRFIYKAF